MAQILMLYFRREIETSNSSYWLHGFYNALMSSRIRSSVSRTCRTSRSAKIMYCQCTFLQTLTLTTLQLEIARNDSHVNAKPSSVEDQVKASYLVASWKPI